MPPLFRSEPVFLGTDESTSALLQPRLGRLRLLLLPLLLERLADLLVGEPVHLLTGLVAVDHLGPENKPGVQKSPTQERRSTRKEINYRVCKDIRTETVHNKKMLRIDHDFRFSSAPN